MAGRELRDDRDRLILHGVALPVIHHGAQAIAAAHVALVHHAALRLPYGLARVEVPRLLRPTAWVGIELRAGPAQRAPRDPVSAVGPDRQETVVVPFPAGLEVCEVFSGAAVGAVDLGGGAVGAGRA